MFLKYFQKGIKTTLISNRNSETIILLFMNWIKRIIIVNWSRRRLFLNIELDDHLKLNWKKIILKLN